MFAVAFAELMTQPRRFPSPWSAELQPNYYVVRDANRQQLAYVYFENEPGRALEITRPSTVTLGTER
jgi:hypothetical protein